MDRAPLSLADINQFVEENRVFPVLIEALFCRNIDEIIVFVKTRLTVLIECLILLFKALLSSLMKLDFLDIFPGVQRRLSSRHTLLMLSEVSVT